MSVYFVLLADCTTFNKLVDIGSQPGPPKVVLEEGFGVESASMSKGRGGVKGGDKHVMGIWGDVHLSFVV